MHNLTDNTLDYIRDLEYINSIKSFSDQELESLYSLLNKMPIHCTILHGNYIYLTFEQIHRTNKLLMAVIDELNTRISITLDNYYKEIAKSDIKLTLQRPELFN